MNALPVEALAVARQFIGAMERRDADAVIALLDDEVVLEFPFPVVAGGDRPGSRRQCGKAAHAGVRGSLQTTIVIKFTNQVWRTTDDGLALLQADGECTLSDGSPYLNHYIFLFEVREGKIVRWWEYLNPVISARAVGIPLDSIP